MKKILLLTLLASQYLFAIISISPVDIGDKAGLSGNVAASLETKRGNTDTDNYKAGLKINYDDNVSAVTWGEIAGSYGKSNDVVDTNKLYLHIRHIHALTPEVVRAEGFIQIQEDRYKDIKQRFLYGGDIRFKLPKTFKKSKAFIAIGAFNEHITYIDENVENNLRINSYLAYTAKLNKTSEVSYSLYYQPKIDDFSDYIESHKLNLKINVYKKLFLNFRITYDVDSKPANDLKKYDFYQETAFTLAF